MADETIDETRPLTITHPTDRWKTKDVTNFYARNLYAEVFTDGKLVYKTQDVYALQRNCMESLDGFWDEYKRLTQPHAYKVDLSDKLYALKQKLIIEEKNGGN